MKNALALLLLSCALVAQDKPKPAAEAPKPASVEKAAESKPKIPPINVRDELIELIHELKEDARRKIESPLHFESSNYRQTAAAKYDSDQKAKAEAQRLLLQALVELAKLPAGSPLQTHSSTGYRE
jgi:hypothetical protein